MNNVETLRLLTEIELLHNCEVAHGIPAGPIMQQLTTEFSRPLPDRLPSAPDWLTFHWPLANSVNFDTPQGKRERWEPWRGKGNEQ